MTAEITGSKKWFVIFGCFFVNFTLAGIQRSAGVLYVALMAQFGTNREQAAWPGGVYSILVSLVGPMASLSIYYWSLRYVVFLSTVLSSLGIIFCYFAYNITYVTFFYGAMPGVGNGIIITLTHVVINRHFHKRRATAAGLAYAGSCIGSFIFPPITEYFLEHYGLRGTFLLLGGIALHSIPGSLFYYPSESENMHESLDSSPCKRKKDTIICIKGDVALVQLKKTKVHNGFSTKYLKSLTDILINPMFIIICTSFSIYFLASATYLMIVVDFALDKSMDENQAVFLISGYSSGDLSGRLISGWIADLECTKRKYIVQITMTLMAIVAAILPSINTYWWMMTLSICLGFASGCTLINFSALMTEYLGIRKLPLAIGMATLIFGLLACVRPSLIGFFRDRSGTYDNLLYMFSAILIFASTLWLFESFFKKHKRKNSQAV
ncbi:monocarboxylate transporter 12-B-like [Centruroides vittatus]|uniref:monocarboxylate transporter 12-B-like n=1 Tax=Centruroides vittatus TaxID=120091 RepID=UPI00350F8062